MLLGGLIVRGELLIKITLLYIKLKKSLFDILGVYKLFPDHTSFIDSLDYNYLRGMSIDRRRFKEALDEVGIIKK